MAAYRRVDDLPSPAGWLPVHRDQLRAQRSVSSMGSLYLFTFYSNLALVRNRLLAIREYCVIKSTRRSSAWRHGRWRRRSRNSGSTGRPVRRLATTTVRTSSTYESKDFTSSLKHCTNQVCRPVCVQNLVPTHYYRVPLGLFAPISWTVSDKNILILPHTVNCVWFCCFGAVCDIFVCVSNVSGTAERICVKFTRKTCLVPRSDEFEGQGQFRRPARGLCLENIFASIVRRLAGTLLWPPYEIGQAIIFLPCGSFLWPPCVADAHIIFLSCFFLLGEARPWHANRGVPECTRMIGHSAVLIIQ